MKRFFVLFLMSFLFSCTTEVWDGNIYGDYKFSSNPNPSLFSGDKSYKWIHPDSNDGNYFIETEISFDSSNRVKIYEYYNLYFYAFYPEFDSFIGIVVFEDNKVKISLVYQYDGDTYDIYYKDYLIIEYSDFINNYK